LGLFSDFKGIVDPAASNLTVIQSHEFEGRTGLSCLALGCVLLVLLIGGLEATHLHADGSGNQCSFCITVHATAPAPMLHALPVFYTIARVATPHRVEDKSTSPELTLFIRPPPVSA
jgi:hypothetical protein